MYEILDIIVIIFISTMKNVMFEKISSLFVFSYASTVNVTKSLYLLNLVATYNNMGMDRDNNVSIDLFATVLFVAKKLISHGNIIN